MWQHSRYRRDGRYGMWCSFRVDSHLFFFFFSSRRRHTRSDRDWSSDVCSSDLLVDLRESMTWEGHAERIRAPYLCVAGEFDELSPLLHTERLMRALQGPKRLVEIGRASCRERG